MTWDTDPLMQIYDFLYGHQLTSVKSQNVYFKPLQDSYKTLVSELVKSRFRLILHLSHAKWEIRGMHDRLWIFCGDYIFRVFDLHPRGIRDISEEQSKMKTLPPMYTTNIIYIIL